MRSDSSEKALQSVGDCPSPYGDYGNLQDLVSWDSGQKQGQKNGDDSSAMGKSFAK
jgi:hypothetical protein